MALVTRTYSLDDPDALRRWQALWEISPQRSPFSMPSYVRAAAEAYALAAAFHFVEDGERDEAALVAFWKQKGPYRLGVIPAFMPYSPLLLRRDVKDHEVHDGTSALDYLLRSLEEKYHAVSFFCFAITDVRAARWRGWDVTPFFTYRISFADYPGLSAWSKSGARHVFRKHEQEYLLRAADTLSTLVDLCAQSYERHARALPGGRAALLRMLRPLHQSGALHVFELVHRESQQVEAAIGILQDGQTACYWLGGSAPGPAMTVLLGKMVLRYQEKGFASFDFVGANTPAIAEFKRKFGPTLTPYYHLERFMRPELRLAHQLKQLLRSVRAR